MVPNTRGVLACLGIVLILSAAAAQAQSVVTSSQGSPVLVPDNQIVPREILRPTESAPLPGDYQFAAGPPVIPPAPRAPRDDLLPIPSGGSPAAPGPRVAAATPGACTACGDSAVAAPAAACDAPLCPQLFGIAYGVCPGIVGGAEMAILRPYVGDPRVLSLILPPAAGVTIPFTDNGFFLTPRIWAGYVGENGLGVRGRYWQFDQDLPAENNALFFAGPFGPIPAGTTVVTAGHLKMFAIDAEVTQQMDLGLWRANLGGGLRVVGIRHDFGATITEPGPVVTNVRDDSQFNGIGPTLFAEFRRPLGSSNFSLVANGRGSLVFGEWLQRTAVDTALFGTAFDFSQKTDTVVGIAEIQLGAQWRRELPGGNLFLQALWEGQVWSGSASALPGGGNRDVALMGVTVGVGISR